MVQYCDTAHTETRRTVMCDTYLVEDSLMCLVVIASYFHTYREAPIVACVFQSVEISRRTCHRKGEIQRKLCDKYDGSF